MYKLLLKTCVNIEIILLSFPLESVSYTTGSLNPWSPSFNVPFPNPREFSSQLGCFTRVTHERKINGNGTEVTLTLPIKVHS